jgi:hypothetical protein
MIEPGIADKFSPFRQALACAALSLVGMVICHFVFRGDSYEFMAAFTGIVLFSIMNSVISVFHESFIKYTWPSWWIFLGLLIVLLLSARGISGISIWTLREYRMMLGSIVVFYIIISLLVRLVRTLWEFAENDEN